LAEHIVMLFFLGGGMDSGSCGEAPVFPIWHRNFLRDCGWATQATWAAGTQVHSKLFFEWLNDAIYCLI
jgi:hypothetical protein